VLIAVVFVGFLVEAVIPVFDALGQVLGWNVPVATLLVSFPLLAFLVMLLERPGPVKNWAVRLLLFLFYPAFALNHDYVAIVDYVKTGHLPSLWATLILNAMIVVCSVNFLRRMVPKVCPSCRRPTLFLLIKLLESEARSSNTFWCASCGKKVWKDKEGTWQPERRQTWLDASEGRPAPPDSAPVTDVLPAPAAPPHLLVGVRAVNEAPTA
jgi:hypothetical protein